MGLATQPPAEIDVDLSLVRALLREQHADLASLALAETGEGWDNRVFRLGTALAVRIPRRAEAAPLIEQEQRWLPGLGARLPLPIPIPVRIGRPGCGFPWHWSVVSWLPGQNAMLAPFDPGSMAGALGRFLRLLHQPAPDDAPHNPWRSIPLASRDDAFRKHLQQVEISRDRQDALLRVWDRALATPPWPGPKLWIHGDLHPGNLLVVRGRLSAVIDFGDLAAGDPATDLAVMWALLPPAARDDFMRSVRGPFHPLDRHTYMRARGWALALGLSWLAASRSNEAMRAMARKGIHAALSDGS